MSQRRKIVGNVMRTRRAHIEHAIVMTMSSPYDLLGFVRQIGVGVEGLQPLDLLGGKLVSAAVGRLT
jgi:hypothetical protein